MDFQYAGGLVRVREYSPPCCPSLQTPLCMSFPPSHQPSCFTPCISHFTFQLTPVCLSQISFTTILTRGTVRTPQPKPQSCANLGGRKEMWESFDSPCSSLHLCLRFPSRSAQYDGNCYCNCNVCHIAGRDLVMGKAV